MLFRAGTVPETQQDDSTVWLLISHAAVSLHAQYITDDTRLTVTGESMQALVKSVTKF